MILALFACTGCGQKEDENRPLIWAADEDGGIPYIFYDHRGKLTGFEKDLADALAKELGREIQFKSYKFESLIPGVLRQDFDFAMNGLEITPDKQQVVRFSRPYYLYQLQFVVRQDEKRISTLEDCQKHKIVVGTLSGSQAEQILKEQKIASLGFEGQPEIYQKLCEGQEIQAVLLDVPVSLYYSVPDATLPNSQAHKYPGLKFAGPPFAEGFYGIAVHPDNVQLAKDMDEAIERLQTSGELKRILEKWRIWNRDQERLSKELGPVGQAKEIPFSVYFPMLLEGARLTVQITVLSFALAIALGMLIALARLYGPAPVRFLATVYVEFFRGIPVLMLLFFLYYGLAGLGLRLGAMEAAILGFGLNYAAFESEIYRAGISSIPMGQWEAAASLGMSPTLTFRRIILPQAIRVILPPMTNDLVALFKDTSVVSIIALVELSKQYQILTRSGAGYLGIGLTTAALYLVMSVPLEYLSRNLEKRWAGGLPPKAT